MRKSFVPRPSQNQIISYRGGTMGVSAVPGSGKTWTLSLLAAEIIDRGLIDNEQEVLVVTLVNSAVDNFSQRISSFLSEMGRVPTLGYRVRTLHGLAHDIVKERPELAGLDDKFQIIDEREADRIRFDSVYEWLRNNPGAFDKFLLPDLDEKKKNNLYQKQIPDLMIQLAFQFIKSAKNYQQTSTQLQHLLMESNEALHLAQLGVDLYETYQRNLVYRGSVDFDDLINYAYKILCLDPDLLLRLQQRWPYILEDEAQDSSQMQQRILSLLSDQSLGKNWVRVGDPNQAIYESFTTADPELFLRFISSADKHYTLPSSGRSTTEIINLANYLVDWANNHHPIDQVRGALYPNMIVPTPVGDAQQNPESKPGQIHLYEEELSPDNELQVVGTSLKGWLESNPEKTVAILAPRNERGKKMAAYLRNKYNIEPVEILNTSLMTRKTTGALVYVLDYLVNPTSLKKLSSLYQVCHRDQQSESEVWPVVVETSEILLSIEKPESFISPGSASDWVDSLADADHHVIEDLKAFRELVLKWQAAALLPIDQLILTIAGDLFHTPEELSLSHRIASFQKYLADQHPDWGLPVLIDELKSLAKNERRFFSSSEETQFNPDSYKGKVVITTAHKAKGLEWDRVYLISANNYNFPSNFPGDSFISERWFIRDNLNIPAESLGQLSSLVNSSISKYVEGQASLASRYEYARERLRLLYVAITRAKKELIITWNNGRSGKSTPAVPFTMLCNFYNNMAE